MPAEFPLLSAVGTPGTVGRLSKCCRSFRTIFSNEEVWEALCIKTVHDISIKGSAVSWHAFYRDWVLSARAWFDAYSHLAAEILQDPSFSMRVEFDGTNIPDEWKGAECLLMEDVAYTRFGVTGRVDMYWSDSSGDDPLPEWTFKSRRVTKIQVIASLNGSLCKIMEIDSTGSGVDALMFARTEEATFSGFKIDSGCWCEDGVDSDDEGYGEHWGEHLSIVAQISTQQFLEAMLGPDQMKTSAATWLGRSLTASVHSPSPMLFAEVRSSIRYSRDELQVFVSDEEQPCVASVASSVPGPSWYNPQHAFQFRRLYTPQFQSWKQNDSGRNLPLPGYKFSFDFSQTKTASRERFLLSFWCLDACGNSTFAHHFVPCRVGCKFKCSFETHPVVTTLSGNHYFVGQIQSSTDVSVGSNGDSNDFELTSLNLMMVPFATMGCFDRDGMLREVILDYSQRLLYRFIAHTCPESAQVTADELERYCNAYCQSRDAAELVEKLCSCAFDEDFDIMSEESDMEEERGYWQDRMVREQEKLINEISAARRFEPGTFWVSSSDEDGKLRPMEERVQTEADRPTVSRKPNKGSVWRGMAPLRRCQRCRCILTGLQECFQRDGDLYRSFCYRCQT